MLSFLQLRLLIKKKFAIQLLKSKKKKNMYSIYINIQILNHNFFNLPRKTTKH